MLISDWSSYLCSAVLAEMADAGHDAARLYSRLRPGVLDALGDPLDMALIRQARHGRVVGRGHELDVDRALAGAADQVFIRHVPVVASGADRRARRIVDLEEVEEAVPGEGAVGGQEAFG